MGRTKTKLMSTLQPFFVPTTTCSDSKQRFFFQKGNRALICCKDFFSCLHFPARPYIQNTFYQELIRQPTIRTRDIVSCSARPLRWFSKLTDTRRKFPAFLIVSRYYTLLKSLSNLISPTSNWCETKDTSYQVGCPEYRTALANNKNVEFNDAVIFQSLP